MSDEDIDLDRVVVDPAYRRRVIEFLNTVAPDAGVGPEPEALAARPILAASEVERGRY